jgi:hypothetical protein
VPSPGNSVSVERPSGPRGWSRPLTKSGHKAEYRRSLRNLFARTTGDLSRTHRRAAVAWARGTRIRWATASYTIACADCDLPSQRVSKCVLNRQRLSRLKSTSPGPCLRSSSLMSSGSSAHLAVLDGARLLTADLGRALRCPSHQDLQTVIRCHGAALEAIGGVPREIRRRRGRNRPGDRSFTCSAFVDQS